MPADPSVINAITSALDAEPDNVNLRLHLIGLLVEADQADQALRHVGVALAAEPDSPAVLAAAADAYRAAGDLQRATRFRRMAAALSPEAAAADEPLDPEDDQHPPNERNQPVRSAPPIEPPAAERLPNGEIMPSEEDMDRFLEEVFAGAGEAPPTVTLADVGGLDEVKRRLRVSFIEPIRNPKLRQMFRKSLQGGLLLYGPPGCGKTFLARAVAGELDAHFISVGLADVLDMWVGKSERNLHEVFEGARRHTPCVLFLDEVDALGLKRSNSPSSTGRNVVVQLLTEMDSTRADNEGLFVLGATNMPWDLDPALRRPGRFDRTVLVEPPDRPARQIILQANLADRPAEGVDLARVAKGTEGYSGADLRLVCEAAAELAMEDSILSGDVRPIRQGDLDRAQREIQPSTREWFRMARNVAMFANEGGTYDDLLAYLRKRNH